MNVSEIIWQEGEKHYQNYLYKVGRKPANLNLMRQLAYFCFLSASIPKDACATPAQLKLAVVGGEVFVDINIVRHAPHRKNPIPVTQRLPLLHESEALMWNALIGISSNQVSVVLDFSPLKYPKKAGMIYRYLKGLTQSVRAELRTAGFMPYGNSLQMLKYLRIYDLLVVRHADIGYAERLLGLSDDTFLTRLGDYGKLIRDSILNEKLNWHREKPKSIEVQQLRTLLQATP